MAVIEKTYRHQQLMVETARRLGVTVGVGTDTGAPGVRHGVSYMEELKLLIEAGFPRRRSSMPPPRKAPEYWAWKNKWAGYCPVCRLT